MNELSKIRIAIIEDERPIAEMYQTRLENEGFEVKIAHDGLEGFSLCQTYRPDLILLDLRMPHMTGEEVLQRLREEEWGALIRVIILTNISRDEAPSILRFLNVDAYAVKAHHTPHQISTMVKEIMN